MMRNEWVPFNRAMEMLSYDDKTAPLIPVGEATNKFSGEGPDVRYRPERFVPRMNPHDWGKFEFNLEDIENWQVWRAADMLKTLPANGIAEAHDGG